MHEVIQLFSFFLLGFILTYLSKKNSSGQKQKKSNIFKISKNLIDEVNKYISQKTKIEFFIFKEKQNEEKPVYLYCDWIKDRIKIKYGEKNNKIEVEYKDQDISYNSESYHKITLVFGEEKEITFNIHILLHNLNIFNLFIDNNDENTFSLEQMFYSKEIKKLNRINKRTDDIKKGTLKCENYKEQYFMRCNQINITKSKLIDIITNYGGNLDENAEIFTKGNPNLFLNILFGKDKKAKIYFFLNEEINNRELNEDDYIFFDSFYHEFIEQKFYEKSKFESEKYYNRLFDILEREYKNNENNNNNIDNKDNINEIDDDSSISDEIKQLENDFKKNLKIYIHYVDKKFLFYLSDILSNKNDLKEKHLLLCQKICLLSLCLIESPYNAIKRFYELKDKFFKIDDISNYDKIKIMISLKSYLTLQNDEYSFIDIVEYNKLTSESPFIQGYLFYKEIVENLKQNSLLTFLFNQLNSGKGFDYFSNTDCYKLKYIPLSIIKIHLLFNYSDNKYFFIYAKESNEHAFTEGYSKDIFFNLRSLELGLSDVNNSPDLLNHSTKIGLVLLHENCHIKFRKIKSFNMNSPRGVIKSDLNIFLNDYTSLKSNNEDIIVTEKHGESGKALEFILFNDNDALSQLLNHKNIEKLKNYKFYIQDNNDDLIKIKNEIMKQITFSFLNKRFNYNASSSTKKIKKINLKKNIYDTIVLTNN